MQWPWPSICLPHGMTSRSLTSSNKHTDQHASVALGPLRPVLLSRRPSLPPAGILLLASVCAAGRPCGRGARVLSVSGLQAERMSGFVSCGLHPCFLSRRRRSITWHAAAGRLKGKSYGLRPNRCHFGVGLLSQSSGQPSQLPQWSVISGVDKHSDRAQEKLGSSRS